MRKCISMERILQEESDMRLETWIHLQTARIGRVQRAPVGIRGTAMDSTRPKCGRVIEPASLPIDETSVGRLTLRTRWKRGAR